MDFRYITFVLKNNYFKILLFSFSVYLFTLGLLSTNESSILAKTIKVLPDKSILVENGDKNVKLFKPGEYVLNGDVLTYKNYDSIFFYFLSAFIVILLSFYIYTHGNYYEGHFGTKRIKAHLEMHKVEVLVDEYIIIYLYDGYRITDTSYLVSYQHLVECLHAFFQTPTEFQKFTP